MGNRYVTSRDNITPTGGADVITIVSASSRRVKLVEVSVSGRGSSSAAQVLHIGRSTGGTGATPGTSSKFDHSEQPAAASVVNTAYSGAATFEANYEVVGWNALGGANRWVPPKGFGVEARNGENISIRAPSGPTYQTCSVSAIFEED